MQMQQQTSSRGTPPEAEQITVSAEAASDSTAPLPQQLSPPRATPTDSGLLLGHGCNSACLGRTAALQLSHAASTSKFFTADRALTGTRWQ